MNWDAIAATAELIGVFGILVSIVYLGMQVRQSNRVAEDNSFQGLMALGNAAMREMSVIENRDIMMKGLLEYGELAASDKLVFDSMLFGLFTTTESILLSSDRQLIHAG